MNNQTEKLRLIYIPFLIIALSVIVGYSYLNWLIMVKLQVFTYNETIVNIIPPFIITGIAVFIWLRPRIKLLSLATTKFGDPLFLFQFIAVILITLPTIVAQDYMIMETGKLTNLENITQIDRHVTTKYYSLKNYFIDKKDTKIYSTSYVSGRGRQYLDLEIYVVCPILPEKSSIYEPTGEKVNYKIPLLVIDGKPCPGLALSAIPSGKILTMTKLSDYAGFQSYGDLAKKGAIVVTTDHFMPEMKVMGQELKLIEPDTIKSWLGIKYTDRISNRISNEEQDTLIKGFLHNSQQDFEKRDVSKFAYLKRLGNADEIEGYQNATGKSSLVHSSKIILLPVLEPFELRNQDNLTWLIISVGAGALLWLIMILFSDLENNEMPESEFGNYRNDQ